MTQVFSLLPLLLALLLMTALLKLVSRLWKRTTLSWKAAGGYVGLMMIATALASAARGSNSLPILLAPLLGLSVHGYLGGVYFGRFASDQQGIRLGFRRGALLALLYIGLLGAVTLVPAVIYFVLRG